MADIVTKAVDEALAEAEARCAARGEKLTPARKRVLQLVLNSSEPLGAYDVLSQLQREGHGKAQPPTAYRALDFLERMGLIHRLDSIRAYVACHHHGHDHAAVFLVCKACGKATEAEADETASMLRCIAQSAGYSALQVIQEVHGRCAECAATLATKTA